MADAALQKSNHTPTKRELQRQMEKTREAVSETVGEIKETVGRHHIGRDRKPGGQAYGTVEVIGSS